MNRILTLLLCASAAGRAATITTFASASAWNSAISPAIPVTETFEGAAPLGGVVRISTGSTASYSIANATIRVDRTSSSNSDVWETRDGVYAPTGVLSVFGYATPDFSNIIFTPVTPVIAFSLNHAAWLGPELRFTLDFADSTQQSFTVASVIPTTSVRSGATPMPFLGVTSDTAITDIRVETTLAWSGGGSASFNLDNFAAVAVPEPSTLGITFAALVAMGLPRSRRVRHSR